MTDLHFELLSWWHAGTGSGLGAIADAVCARDASNLPYLPGRTVKGLLRAACRIAETAGHIGVGRTELLFGTELAASALDNSMQDDAVDKAKEQARFTTVPGILRFTSATLPEAWQAWGRTRNPASPELRHLFHLVATTAIDEAGVVQDHTLRTIEVAAPMVLVARVECTAPDDRWHDDLNTALPLIRAVGAHRNRGLGRVEVRMVPR